MRKLVIIASNINRNFTYDDIIDVMIKGYKMRFKNPKAEVYCLLKDTPIKKYDEMYRILCSVYDNVLFDKVYPRAEYINSDDIGKGEDEFDSQYEYDQIKKSIGPLMRNHFMFKEHDIILKQRGGFDFTKNKIKFLEKDPIHELVAKLYNDGDVNYNLLKYYHVLNNISYKPDNIASMFDQVGKYDYSEPLKRLSKYYPEGNYYQKLYERNKEELSYLEEKRLSLNETNKISESDKDSIIIQYIKCRPSIKLIIINGSVVGGNSYYVKTLKLSKKSIKNLLYWIYDDISNIARLEIADLISNKIEDEISIVITDSDIYSDDIVNMSNTFHQLIEQSQLFFNKNTLENLDNQETLKDKLSFLKLQTLRHLLYTDLSLLEMDRVVSKTNIDDTFKDIDLFIIENNDTSGNDKLDKYAKKLKMHFIKISNQKDNLKYLDPSEYYYYCGVKVLKN